MALCPQNMNDLGISLSKLLCNKKNRPIVSDNRQSSFKFGDIIMKFTWFSTT